MTVRTLYFALIRERLHATGEEIVLPEGSTVADLLDHLTRRHPVLAGIDLHRALRVAVNHTFVPLDHILQQGDEVALIPPVSGGAAYCRLSSAPLDLAEVIQVVSGPGQGGVVTFSGVVRQHSRGRNVVRLEYEAYGPMAHRALAAVIDRIEAAGPGVRVAIVHRTGVLQVGEIAVVIAASAPHRAQAFDACREAIDRLKEEVPIWKKEVSDTGEEWIGTGP